VSAVAIDFILSDSQQELQENARAFAESVLRPVAGRIDRAADGWESFLAGREAFREMAPRRLHQVVHPGRVRRGRLLHALRHRR
jgi:alkylation response protein AidB-like acyl-CoA dehydrogenase